MDLGSRKGWVAEGGRLTSEQDSFRRSSDDWYDANLANPSLIDPTTYDRALGPGAEAWFKASALEHVEQVSGHVEILAMYQVGCELIRSSDQGEVIYGDDHQVIVVPYGLCRQQRAYTPANSPAPR
ncbi:hypothetical protein K388_06468 [Streptomyces sp. KhCrAH-43]|uniref:hypothetical protein n=1 Tax=unclassified Streptomyces TaxID=2593676 RepID=UPI00035CCB7B|nr:MULTISPECIES: hypothetical protein [unclassified Streptomyces]MYS34319.1 hypothetical protein [Streptomyces sp. SID4920]MYX68516.1 hypothetical protein [Streptomyces sp. SID8373]RAJ50757.1 hypothetical protein K388_06468 [Streptomyces sp. KhCrAH-43]